MASVDTLHMVLPVLQLESGAHSEENNVKITSLSQKSISPPKAESFLRLCRSRSWALDDDYDYFERRVLRALCVQRLPLPDDFHPQASEIIPGLFLCDMYTATSATVLAHLGITHIASITREADLRCSSLNVEQMCIPVDDLPTADLLKYFDPAIRWISNALRNGGRVMVHCMWGMSRSATVIIAYLITMNHLSLEEAFRLVKQKRWVVRPNSGFLDQLRVYERVTRLREGYGKPSVWL